MTGEFWINDKDAFTQWGITVADGSLSALMTPAPTKGYITNDNAAANGKQVYRTDFTPLAAERDVQLTIYLHATSSATFYARYASFCEELEKGFLNLRSKYQPGVTYKCLYTSCQQFSQFNGRLAKFVLRLNEPNPKDRS